MGALYLENKLATRVLMRPRTTATSWRSQCCAACRTPSGPISPGYGALNL